MLFLFLTLWIAGAILLLSDSKRESTYWASATAFCGGAGGLSVVFEEKVTYYMAILFKSQIMDSMVHFAEHFLSFASHYGTPYAFAMFAISYSGLFTKKWIRRMACILFSPVVFMVLFSPVFPQLVVPYSVAILWVAPYILCGVFILLYSFMKEDNTLTKRNRFYTNVVFIPAILFGLVTNYIFRVFQIHDAWRYNTWVIAFSVTLFFVIILRYGFMGVKLSLHKQQLHYRMQAMTSGSTILQHAIKNDIGKIKLFGEKIKYYASDSEQVELEEDVNVIIEAQRQMQRRMDRFREQTKDITLFRKTTSLKEIVEGNLRCLKPAMSNINIQTHYSDTLYLRCDHEHMKEVIYNLLLNAIEAMPNGGDLTITLYETRRNVVLEIRDTGTGIPEIHLNDIFEPFYTTKSCSQKNYGLGLSYCYNAVKKHGGTLTVQSKEHKGTTMKLDFPKKLVQVKEMRDGTYSSASR